MMMMMVMLWGGREGRSTTGVQIRDLVRLVCGPCVGVEALGRGSEHGQTV